MGFHKIIEAAIEVHRIFGLLVNFGQEYVKDGMTRLVNRL